jgi:hypothetical protein
MPKKSAGRIERNLQAHSFLHPRSGSLETHPLQWVGLRKQENWADSTKYVANRVPTTEEDQAAWREGAAGWRSTPSR